MKVKANFNHLEQNTFFLMLIFGNLAGRCDYNLDLEFLPI